jgi:formylglycine-generating enzyme required for sulfatase activity
VPTDIIGQWHYNVGCTSLPKHLMDESIKPIKIFLSYAHRDDEYRQELMVQLSSLLNRKLVEIWHDRQILAGSDWATDISQSLELADIILFLVSADFIDSKYCYGIEMARAIEREQAQTARAIPVIIRYCDWQPTPLGKLQALPRDGRPVAAWGNKPWDEPLLLVVKEIEKVAKDIQVQRRSGWLAAQKAQAIVEFKEFAVGHYRDGVLLPAERTLLNLKQRELLLTAPEVDEILGAIEAEIQQHQANLEIYRSTVIAELQGVKELTVDRRRALQQVQEALGISFSEAEELEQQVVAELRERYFQFEVVTFDGQGGELSRVQQQAEFFAEILGDLTSLEMVKIPGGRFQMGSLLNQGRDDEWPRHEVQVPEFWMGKYPVTQAQWRYVAALPPEQMELEANPARFEGDNRPVENVSWNQLIEFCQRLSRKTGKEYRLPSEAEWEYACRAKTLTNFYFGDALTPKLANYGQEMKGTTDVGIYLPNAFGLYDMHGNVWEWCADGWHNSYENAPVDGSAWIDSNSSMYILRGGSWFGNPFNCRSAYRYRYFIDYYYFNVGFRVVYAPART